jgi:hypothetical protein
VRKATERSLLLYDSGGLKRIDRRRCALEASDDPSRHHLLYPEQTLFLWVD